jgi:hypothetical protein
VTPDPDHASRRGNSVSFADARTIDRRDAAVAAALAGMVVVVLGYASGLGLRTSNASAAPSVPGVSAAPPSATAPGTPTTPPSTGTTTHGAETHGSATPSDQHSASSNHTQTTDTHTDPMAPHGSAPTPAPAPTPTASAGTCQPGLLEGLPLAGPAVGSVSSLLTPVLGSPTDQSGLLTCTVGAVLGPRCCTTSAARTDANG